MTSPSQSTPQDNHIPKDKQPRWLVDEHFLFKTYEQAQRQQTKTGGKIRLVYVSVLPQGHRQAKKKSPSKKYDPTAPLPESLDIILGR